MNTWRFIRSSSGYWLWQSSSLTDVERVSERYFETRTDCIANAVEHGFSTHRGMAMADTNNDFSWSDDSLVVVKRVDAIAVYRNPEGDIVIRQERRGGAEDNVVIVPGQYAYTLVESVQRLLKGQLFSMTGDSR